MNEADMCFRGMQMLENRNAFLTKRLYRFVMLFVASLHVIPYRTERVNLFVELNWLQKGLGLGIRSDI